MGQGDYDFFATTAHRSVAGPDVAAPGTHPGAQAPWPAGPGFIPGARDVVHAAPPGRARPWLLVAAVVALAALVAAIVVLRPHPRDDRPVVLPDTLGGLAVAPAIDQFIDRANWRGTTGDPAYGDHPYDGRVYGHIPGRPLVMVYLLVGRTGSSDLPDIRNTRAPFRTYGAVTCSRSFEYPDAPEGQKTVTNATRRVVCFRQRGTLTVSVLSEFADAATFEPQVAAMVDEAWDLNA